MADISGVWHNELGSMMRIAASDGQLSGQYSSAVGDAKDFYQLVGRFNTAPAAGGQSCAWAVTWVNSYGNAHSTTAWAGQYQIDESGAEEISAFWFLVSEMAPQDDWQATKVGQDIFTRLAPTPEAVKKAQQRGHASSPPAPVDA